jgi:hypothetical protein
LSAVTFIVVLWVVGGALDVKLGGVELHIPGFLVIAALVYSLLATGAMVLIGQQFIRLSERNNQREAEFRYALTRLRENGESIALLGGEKEERAGLARTFGNLLESWRIILHQYMRTTFVSTTSGYVASVVPIFLCAPKYLAGTMSLGDVMQAVSAFGIVQGAFSWLVDNYPRFANWSASARRITSLLVSISALERADRQGGIKRLTGSAEGQPALRLRGHYLALATFALAVAMPQILKYKHIEQLTGGVQGIVIIKPDPPFGLKVTPDQWLYLFTLAVLVVMFVIGWPNVAFWIVPHSPLVVGSVSTQSGTKLPLRGSPAG